MTHSSFAPIAQHTAEASSVPADFNPFKISVGSNDNFVLPEDVYHSFIGGVIINGLEINKFNGKEVEQVTILFGSYEEASPDANIHLIFKKCQPVLNDNSTLTKIYTALRMQPSDDLREIIGKPIRLALGISRNANNNEYNSISSFLPATVSVPVKPLEIPKFLAKTIKYSAGNIIIPTLTEADYQTGNQSYNAQRPVAQPATRLNRNEMSEHRSNITANANAGLTSYVNNGLSGLAQVSNRTLPSF